MERVERVPRAKQSVILREEFSDYAILFDPTTGNGFGLAEVGVAIWKLLDGRHSFDDIVAALRSGFDQVPDQLPNDVADFLNELVTEGLAAYGSS